MWLRRVRRLTGFDTTIVVDVHPSDSSGALGAPLAILGPKPSESGAAIACSIFYQLPRMRQLGYSTPVLNQLFFSRLPTSNQTYETKWRLLEKLCRKRSVDAFTASPTVFADFLLWLASARSASYSTPAGYRSALGHVLCLSTGYCPRTCPVLSQLIQSFKRTQPRPCRRIPQ